MIYEGFAPFFREDSKILVLGSFPSVKSREVNFYYGNKQNRFWKVLAAVFKDDVPENTAQKKDFLIRHKIALWDVVTQCEIIGSMDSAIKNPVIAEIYSVLNGSSVEKILINGKKAYALFIKRYPELHSKTVCLPSTSPANAHFKFSSWENALI